MKYEQTLDQIKFTWITDGTEYWIVLRDYVVGTNQFVIESIMDMETSKHVLFDWQFVSGKLDNGYRDIIATLAHVNALLFESTVETKATIGTG